MTTLNNLTIEQMREIVEGAPSWAITINIHNGMYHAKSEYNTGDYKKGDMFLLDLRTAIAEHDNTDIGTEIDSFLDAFKSPELTDDRKDELTQDWKGMSGGVAFSLIERHADNWKEIDYMMNQWLEANKEAERHG